MGGKSMMKVKEYEQRLLQNLAREQEDIIRKEEKINILIIRGREHTLNKIIEQFMGFKIDFVRIGKNIYRYRYIKDEKVRHIRNMFKRR
jgi:hypothetical protein